MHIHIYTHTYTYTAVTHVFKFRCSRWPPQAQVIAEVDSLQRKMIATAVRLPRRAGEEIGEYCRRRGHNAGVVARCEGRWSMLWRQRVLAWDDHPHRDRNQSSWAAQLVAFKDREWFARRRSLLNSPSVHAGVTGTRAFSRLVHTRWHNGVALALRAKR